MINKSARKAGESARKPKSAKPDQPLKPLSRFYQKPEPDPRQANQSGLSQISKKSDRVRHVEAEVVDETRNGNQSDNSPYKRRRIPEDQIPIVMGTKQRSWWKRLIEILRRPLFFWRKN